MRSFDGDIGTRGCTTSRHNTLADVCCAEYDGAAPLAGVLGTESDEGNATLAAVFHELDEENALSNDWKASLGGAGAA